MGRVAHHQPPAMVEPGQQARHRPPATVTAPGAPVLHGRWLAVGPVRRAQGDPDGGPWRLQWLAVVRLIPPPPFRGLGGQDLHKGGWAKGDVRRRRSRRVAGERQTRAGGPRHARRARAPRGRSHPWPPGVATTNVPARPHGWKRRGPVCYGGKRSGRSGQRAPRRSSPRRPLRPSRASRQGRPRPSARRGGLGINRAMMVHGSSVSSARRARRWIIAQRAGIDETASSRSGSSMGAKWPPAGITVHRLRL